MNEKERQIIQYIADNSKCTINNISSYTGINYQSVKRALFGRKDRGAGGLLDKIKGLKMEEKTDIDYKRERDTVISSVEGELLNSV